jgi:hypothetical protein
MCHNLLTLAILRRDSSLNLEKTPYIMAARYCLHPFLPLWLTSHRIIDNTLMHIISIADQKHGGMWENQFTFMKIFALNCNFCKAYIIVYHI